MKKLCCLLLCCILMLNLLALPVFAQTMSVSEVEEISDIDNVDENEIFLAVNTALQVDVKAKACILMDANTGTVLMAKNEDEQLYPASVTKIMTLLLVCEAIDEGKLTFEQTLTCSEEAASKGGSQIWLEPGEVMSVRDLFKAAAVYSANDACAVLSEAVAGSEAAFVDMMNARANQLGMVNTNFDNCSGLDDDTDTHKSTARDIAIMSRELLKHRYITEYSTIWMDSVRNGETQLVNTNRLVRYYSGATGLKTGTTSKAGCCISASAERDGLHLIAVVLGADNSNDRFNSAKALLDWGFANYEIYSPIIDTALLEDVAVLHGVSEKVSLYAAEAQPLLLNKGAGQRVEVIYEIPENISAPVYTGQELGKIVFTAGGVTLAEYGLYAQNDVEKITFFTAWLKLFRSFVKNVKEN